jgi:hypothetical protein
MNTKTSEGNSRAGSRGMTKAGNVRRFAGKLISTTTISGCALALCLLIATPILAQDESPSTGQTPQAGGTKPAGKAGALAIPDSSDQAPTGSAAPPIQELGRGGWLGGTTSPLRWRSLYINSLEIDQGYDQFSGGSSTPTGIFRTSFLQASVVYDLQLSRSRLAFQWLPEVGSINGHFANNLSNENVGLDYGTLLTPRLSMHIRDQFEYSTARNLFFDSYLYAAQTPGNQSVQNTFLDGPGTRLANNAMVTVDYRLSPTTDLVLTPGFNYAKQSAGSKIIVGSKEYTGAVHVTHQFSPTMSAGLLYITNAVKFDNVAGYVIYHTVGGSFTKQLSPTWFFNSALGVSRATINGSSSYWTLFGDAVLQKKFRVSSVGLTYSRGLSLEQFATQYYTDRVDLAYSMQLTRRLFASVGSGYERAGGSQKVSGEYASSQVGYNLLRSLSLIGTYTYRSQVGDLSQLYTETRHTGYITLRWTPPRVR